MNFGVVRTFLTKSYTRREMMRNSKWLFLVIAATSIELALLSLFYSTHPDNILLGAAAVFLAGALCAYFWIHLLLMLVWTGSLIHDFTVRQNPFSLFFILIGLYQSFHFLRSIPRKDHPPPTPVTPQ